MKFKQANKEVTQNQYFVVTSCRLAGQLMQTGAEYTKTINALHPDLIAWRFVLTEQTASIIAGFFTSIHKPIPTCVYEYLHERG